MLKIIDEYKILLQQNTDEKRIFQKFLDFLNNNKIDILAGHNILGFDLPFVVSRCEYYGLKHLFRAGKNSRKITDIVDTYHLVAMYDFIARKLTSYNLKKVVIELGLRENKRLELTKDEITYYYQKSVLPKSSLYDLI